MIRSSYYDKLNTMKGKSLAYAVLFESSRRDRALASKHTSLENATHALGRNVEIWPSAWIEKYRGPSNGRPITFESVTNEAGDEVFRRGNQWSTYIENNFDPAIFLVTPGLRIWKFQLNGSYPAVYIGSKWPNVHRADQWLWRVSIYSCSRGEHNDYYLNVLRSIIRLPGQDRATIAWATERALELENSPRVVVVDSLA